MIYWKSIEDLKSHIEQVKDRYQTTADSVMSGKISKSKAREELAKLNAVCTELDLILTIIIDTEKAFGSFPITEDQWQEMKTLMVDIDTGE